MKRMNKTSNNLSAIWKQLDEASGLLYNALNNISSMSGLPENIKSEIDMIDITRIDSLKHEIENLIQEKESL